MQINPSEFHIEFVKHAVIAGAELEFRTALQSFVREIFQSRSHFINLALHHFTDADRQIVKGLREGVRPDLKRGSHDYFDWRVV